MKLPRFSSQLVLFAWLGMGFGASQAESPSVPIPTTSPAKRVYETVQVEPGAANPTLHLVNATVEAVRQTQLSAQVSGAVVSLGVQVGEHVKAGQTLLRLDSSHALDQAAANDALVDAAKSALVLASRDWERQKQLFEKQYIRQAGLERAQAQWETAQAHLAAAQAQARAAGHQSHFYQITAPYDGIVAEVGTALGDMALPGKPLITLYDPRALRLTAFVPESVRAQLAPGAQLSYDFSENDAPQAVAHSEWLPVSDPSTHSMVLRVPLPGASAMRQPGQFARVWLPLRARVDKAGQGFWIPVSATLKRAEMSGVYVQKTNGELTLRQVRLGEVRGPQVEVLSGLNANERVVRDARLVTAKVP